MQTRACQRACQMACQREQIRKGLCRSSCSPSRLALKILRAELSTRKLDLQALVVICLPQRRPCFFFTKKKPSHSSIDDDYNEELKLGGASYPRQNNVILKTGPWSLFLIVVLVLSSVLSSWVVLFKVKYSLQHDLGSLALARPSLYCQQPSIRREWRTLKVAEQHDYVRAVRCLATKLSKLGNIETMYDDFPWMPKHTSSNSTYTISKFATIASLRSYLLTTLQHVQLMRPLHSFHSIATTSTCTRQL